MDLFEAVRRRHSYRNDFKATPIPREHLREIVEAGIKAPSAANEQVTSFVIVDDPSLLAEMTQIIDRPVCNTARAMIACVSDPRPVHRGVSYAVEDCAASVENMLLAITALGYATVWLDGVLRTDDKIPRLGQLLGVPEGRSIRVVLPLGVPAEQLSQKEKLPFEKRAWFNRFGV